MRSLILVSLFFIALVSCQYQIVSTWDSSSCSGNPLNIAAIASSSCSAVGCFTLLGVSASTSCGAVPSGYPGSTVQTTYTSNDCSGSPSSVLIQGGCYGAIGIYSSYTCKNNVVTYGVYSDSACTTATSNASFAVGNCTGGFGSSYKYTCGGIVNLPNFLMLLALLAVSLYLSLNLEQKRNS